jgi:hypothetical protein
MFLYIPKELDYSATGPKETENKITIEAAPVNLSEYKFTQENQHTRDTLSNLLKQYMPLMLVLTLATSKR